MSENNAIVLTPLQDERVQLTSTGLVLADGLPYDAWEAIGVALQRIEGMIQFALGDWLNYGERAYGEKYAQAVEETEYTYGTLRNYAWVSGKIEMSRRRDNLPHSLYTEIANLEPETQDYYLDWCEETDPPRTRAALRSKLHNDKRNEEVARLQLLPVVTSKDIQVIHDDCLHYLPSLPDNSIDLIILDPPYYQVVSEGWDNQWPTLDDYLNWCRQWMIEAKRVLNPTGSLYLWGGVGERGGYIIQQKLLLDDIGLIFKDWITLKKARGMGHRRGWLYTREECLWYVKDNDLFTWNEDGQYSDEPNLFTVGFGGHAVKSEYKRITNVWTDIPEQLTGRDTLHYTPKPLVAITRIILAHTQPGELVLDFFAGSGTTGEACQKTKRRAIMVENDPVSIQEINARLQP